MGNNHLKHLHPIKTEVTLTIESDMPFVYSETGQNNRTHDQSEQDFSLGPCYFDKLPVELIYKILSFLSSDERVTASTVCHRWRSAFIDSGMSPIEIHVNNNAFNHSNSSSKLALLNLYVNANHLTFENDAANPTALLDYLKRTNCQHPLLPKLDSLTFNKCSLNAKALFNVCLESPRLTSLSIVHCDSFFMTGFISYTPNVTIQLPNLQRLSLSKNRLLTNSLFNIFVQNAPNLQAIDMSYCQLTKQPSIHVKPKHKQHKSSLNENYDTDINHSEICSSNSISNSMLTLDNLTEELVKLVNLRELNLSGIRLFNNDDDLIVNLLENLPHLESVSLAHTPNMKIVNLKKLLRLLPKLTYLDISESLQHFTNAGRFEDVLNFEPGFQSQLSTLKLHKAVSIQNPVELSQHLVNLKHLTYLDLSGLQIQRNFPSIDELTKCIEEFACFMAQCDTLTTLILSNCDVLVTDEFIKIISRRLLKLERLDLRNCQQLTDTSMHFICTHLRQLTHLDVSWCSALTDRALSKTIETTLDDVDTSTEDVLSGKETMILRTVNNQPFKRLKLKAEAAAFLEQGQALNKLNIDPNQAPSYDEPPTYTEAIEISDSVSLKNLSQLTVLRMEACTKITDSGLTFIFDGSLPYLKELDIRLCSRVTGSSIYGPGLLSLKVINLSKCFLFNEDHLLELVMKRAPRLRELSVSTIPEVTDRFIAHLVMKRRFLQHLDISFCQNVSKRAVEKYEELLYEEFGARTFVLETRGVLD